MACYYDMRYLVIQLVVLSTSFADFEANDSSFLVNELKLLLLFVLMSVFLLKSTDIKLVCWSEIHFEPRSGKLAMSIPVTVSLLITLYLPRSAFWNGYLVIFLMSFWSHSINSFFIGFDHTEERGLELPIVHPQQDPTQQHQLLQYLSIQQAAIDIEAATVDELET